MQIKKDVTANHSGHYRKNSIQFNITSFSDQENNKQEFLHAMQRADIHYLGNIVADGKIHRFASNGKGGKNCWYVFFGIAGAFGDWSRDIKEKWSIKYDHLSPEDQKRIKGQITKKKKACEESIEKGYEEIAQEANGKWQSYAVEGKSNYLVRKRILASGVRFDKSTIVVPIRDIEGKLWSLQYIHESGFKSFLTGGRKKGGFYVLGDILKDTTFVYVTEGYATAASVYMAMNIPVIVAFDAGNIEPVVKSLRQKYPHLKICIIGDDDLWKKDNKGRESAEKVANEYGCSVVFPVFKNTDKQPTDFNDLHILEGLEVVTNQLEKQQECEVSGNMTMHNQTNILSIPDGFRVTKSGIEYLTTQKTDNDNKNEEWKWMCSYLVVTALTCDENNLNHGCILEYTDPKGIKKEYVMPMELLAGSGEELRKNLLSRGVRFASKPQARNKFLDYLSSSKPTAKATCVDKVGWFKKQYILPEKVYGLATERVILQSRSSVIQKITYSGTLEEWQQRIGKYIIGNPILCLSACAALAAPLLKLLNEENFVIHLSGSSSIGKTTAIHLARSMWGNEIHSWRTTDNAAESLARNANDGILIFDELGEVDAKSLDNMAYMLGNGSGKRRANRNGDAKPVTTFREVILSTGEVGLEGKLNDIGKSQRAGQSVRFIEVYADMGNNHGIYKELHGFEDGAQLSNYLRQETELYEGVVIDEWLKLLTQEDEQKEIIGLIKHRRQEWAEKYIPDQADGQIQRCGQKFALLAAVGEVAISFGILPPYEMDQQTEKPILGALSASINELFQSWISRRGGKHHDSYELTEVINNLKNFINQHGSSRFEIDNDGDQKVPNRAGYRKTNYADKQWHYYFFQPAFEREILKGKDKKVFLKRLADKGILQRDGEGKYTKSASFAGQNQQRYICIDSGALNMQDEGA